MYLREGLKNAKTLMNTPIYDHIVIRELLSYKELHQKYF